MYMRSIRVMRIKLNMKRCDELHRFIFNYKIQRQQKIPAGMTSGICFDICSLRFVI